MDSSLPRRLRKLSLGAEARPRDETQRSIPLSDPQQFVWVSAERPGDHQIFCDVQSAFPALVFRYEGLGPTQFLRQPHLSDA
jgi:hypothetical protein